MAPHRRPMPGLALSRPRDDVLCGSGTWLERPGVRRAVAAAARCAALGYASVMIACAPRLPDAATGSASVAMLGDRVEREAVAPEEAPAATADARREPRPSGRPQTGQASFYGPEFTGRKMANGRRFDPRSVSVAHRTLPFGTTVVVKHLGNGRSTRAVVEDRGPFIHGRIIDLSPRLAEHLGMIRQGVAAVEVTPIELAEALN
jgi:rare lipoprotein A